jgi:hypothetical protein
MAIIKQGFGRGAKILYIKVAQKWGKQWIKKRRIKWNNRKAKINLTV